MKIQELANLVAVTIEETLEVKVGKERAKIITQSVFDNIKESLGNGEAVDIFGFGKFEVRERAARKGRNPQTGVEIDIAASKAPAFKPAKALKDKVKVD